MDLYVRGGQDNVLGGKVERKDGKGSDEAGLLWASEYLLGTVQQAQGLFGSRGLQIPWQVALGIICIETTARGWRVSSPGGPGGEGRPVPVQSAMPGTLGMV